MLAASADKAACASCPTGRESSAYNRHAWRVQSPWRQARRRHRRGGRPPRASVMGDFFSTPTTRSLPDHRVPSKGPWPVEPRSGRASPVPHEGDTMGVTSRPSARAVRRALGAASLRGMTSTDVIHGPSSTRWSTCSWTKPCRGRGPQRRTPSAPVELNGSACHRLLPVLTSERNSAGRGVDCHGITASRRCHRRRCHVHGARGNCITYLPSSRPVEGMS